MVRSHKRSERVAQAVREIVSNLLLTGDIHDPRLAQVVITDCRMTDDLGIARIYYTVLGVGPPRGRRRRAVRGSARRPRWIGGATVGGLRRRGR